MPRIVAVAFLAIAATTMIAAQGVKTNEQRIKQRTILTLSNEQVECSVVIDSTALIADKLVGQSAWVKQNGGSPGLLETDADFAIELMWTDWQAPGKVNNADNPVRLTKKDFQIYGHKFTEGDGGRRELTLYMHGKDAPLLARLVYQLDPKSFYVRRKLAIADTNDAGHFLQWIWPREGLMSGKRPVIKDGGFGQPIAFQEKASGGFFGLEYPASENTVQADAKGLRISCGQEVGEQITKAGFESEWAVEGITPNSSVKHWFMRYVDDIRVAPLKPYTLYNSWYDLRSPEYPKVPQGNIMNEQNIFRIIDLINKNMIEKHNIKLDAFVLDDGWDVYGSDWVLRQEQFPRGLKPISDELKKTNTNLGMWLGPTGGYSFRMKRLDWMKEHGYEIVGHTRNTAMLCLAGKKYSELFRKRTTDFVANEGVAFFKWDGIQFSCSEPDHGHPVGIYSRRAVMESLINKCRAVREKNPNTFLNITSGTWLSPWWVKYANQIWMQGADYGYADIPSISPRDAAITYRDFVLYDDFQNQKMWFPIANLMTHGIIKGNLEMLGGKEEPLDKFTNEVLLYFARGVSMWELYISPDVLTEGEWDAMGQAMHWARDRFPILSTTEMVGGDPTKGQPYGYTHYSGERGIVAVRNPLITPTSLKVKLSAEQGLDPGASSLVLDKVYPSRRISPRLYRAGATLDLPLEGYETAIYEVYPLAEASEPLLAGVRFDARKMNENTSAVSIYEKSPDAKLLNSDWVESVASTQGKTSLKTILGKTHEQPPAIRERSAGFTATKSNIEVTFTLDESVREGTLLILLTPAKETASKKLPQVRVTLDGREDTAKFEQGEGASTWYRMNISPGKHTAQIRVTTREEGKSWSGRASVWMVCQQQQTAVNFAFNTTRRIGDRPMPPQPFQPGVVAKNIRLGEAQLISSQ